MPSTEQRQPDRRGRGVEATDPGHLDEEAQHEDGEAGQVLAGGHAAVHRVLKVLQLLVQKAHKVGQLRP